MAAEGAGVKDQAGQVWQECFNCKCCKDQAGQVWQECFNCKCWCSP